MPDAPRSSLDTEFPASELPLPELPDSDFWGPADPHDRVPRFGSVSPHWGGPMDRLLDRFREWRTDPRLGVVALLVVALAAGVIWYRMGAASSGAGDAPAARPVATSKLPAPSTTMAASARVAVHVAGAVVAPGVYELAGTARVIDAVEAAGGGVADADLDRLNLAAKVVDGQRVLVQKVGEPAAAPIPGDPSSASTAGSAVPGAPVNLNTATQAELETLPGIGPTLAQAIIAERERRGGFRSVNELRSVRGIGDKRFADLEGSVTI